MFLIFLTISLTFTTTPDEGIIACMTFCLFVSVGFDIMHVVALFRRRMACDYMGIIKFSHILKHLTIFQKFLLTDKKVSE